MDLDVLLFDDCVGEWPGLRLPRADLLRRAYMLRPAAELQPARLHPTAHHSLQQLWQDFAVDAPALTRIELDLNAD
jgi:2-amino-4-hydroxy-6-hydroxymethyldihydropteridine diphosphokinase